MGFRNRRQSGRFLFWNSCSTPKNKNAEWILFEAGALSLHMETRRYTVVSFNVPFSDLPSPLQHFQNTKPEKDDLYELLKSINNELKGGGVLPEALNRQFKAHWQRMEDNIREINTEIPKYGQDQTRVGGSENMPVEAQAYLREIYSMLRDPRKILPEYYLEEVVGQSSLIDKSVAQFGPYIHEMKAIGEQAAYLRRDLEYLMDKESSPELREDIVGRISKIENDILKIHSDVERNRR